MQLHTNTVPSHPHLIPSHQRSFIKSLKQIIQVLPSSQHPASSASIHPPGHENPLSSITLARFEPSSHCPEYRTSSTISPRNASLSLPGSIGHSCCEQPQFLDHAFAPVHRANSALEERKVSCSSSNSNSNSNSNRRLWQEMSSHCLLYQCVSKVVIHRMASAVDRNTEGAFVHLSASCATSSLFLAAERENDSCRASAR